MRRAFTLVELLVAMVVVAVLAAIMAGAVSRASLAAKEQKSRAIVAKLNTQVMLRWESYRTRRLPIDVQAVSVARLMTSGRSQSDAQVMIAAGIDPAIIPPNNRFANAPYLATTRLLAIRELMRLEMPKRWEDVTSNLAAWPSAPPATTVTLTTVPSLSLAYLRRLNAVDPAKYPGGPTDQHQSAECLYMLVTMGIDDVSLGTDHLHSSDVGDKDNDGMPEFHDGFGNPVSFIRWAPGFVSDLQPDPTVPDVVTFASLNHDPFDPLKLDMPTAGGDPRGFKLHPLIYSAGPDGVQDVFGYSAGLSPAQANDPYYRPAGGMFAGTPMTASTPTPGNGEAADNIHNHFLEKK